MDISPDNRVAGVLVPLFALRGKDDLGIGDTAALLELIDWAADVGFGVVQILPINETGGDHSPYNAISSMAIEPTTLAPCFLEDLTDFEIERPRDETAAARSVNYERLKILKRDLLERAFAHFQRAHLKDQTPRAHEFQTFVTEQSAWLEDYTLFRTLMEAHADNAQWRQWPEAHRSPQDARHWLLEVPDAPHFQERMRFFAYVQWQAALQWCRVKAHARSRRVALMGDIPFGISAHSADLWSTPQFFTAGWCGGTPPDRNFKHDPFVIRWGQNWGIPLYNWEAFDFAHASNWWSRRVRGVREFFDLFRIDHILGFYRIYAFPWSPEENARFLPLTRDQAGALLDGRLPQFLPRADDTEAHRQRNRMEGGNYLRAIVKEAGVGRVIGEDLGEVPDYVRPSLRGLGIAGYKVPQWEKFGDGRFIPGEDYERLSVAMYGTHDHEPLKALWEQLSAEAARGDEGARRERMHFGEYCRFQKPLPDAFTPDLHQALLRALFESNSWIASLMITDVFARGERFNLPGVSSGTNWTCRMHCPVKDLAADPASARISALIRESGRGAGL